MKFLEEYETLFRNEDVFNYEFLPEKLPGRETEIEEISLTIKPLVHNRTPSNLFISGPRGVGKTACVRFVFRQVEENTPIKTSFINCWEHSSSFSILQKVAIDIGIPIPRKGVSKDELISVMRNKIKNVKGVAVALDEVDKLEEQDILYQLTEFFGKKIAIVLITNHKEFLLDLEERIKSRLGLLHLEFNPYTKDQVEEILRERIKIGLKPGAIDEKAFNLIVDACYKSEDIRKGLFLILTAGRIAENKQRLKIKVEDVKEAIDKMKESFDVDTKKITNPEEKFILECIKKNPGKTSGEIFKYYKKNGGKLGERSYRKYINHLIQLNLIEAKELNKGQRGRTRVLNPKC